MPINRRQAKKARNRAKAVGNPTKMPKGIPSSVKSTSPSSNVKKGQNLLRDNPIGMVKSISDIRNASSVDEGIRMLAKDDGVTSTAVFMASAIANTKLKITAFDTNTQQFNPEATRILHSTRASMDTISDYTKGFQSRPTIREFCLQALNELMICSGIGCELVLSKDRLPEYIKSVSYSSLEFASDGAGGIYPKQKVKGGTDVELDIPNFFVTEINKTPGEVYAVPILRAALSTSITNGEFIEDMRRVLSKTGHSRLVVTLDSQAIAASADPDIQADPQKLMAYLQKYQEQVSASLSALSPEDSVVVFDTVDVDVADIGGEKSDYVPLMKAMNNLQSTSLKTPSSITGLRSEGSQSLSNIESLTYLKMLGALQGPVADILSRAFTLAIRLYGMDVYAKVEFTPINLRPEDELEAYRTMQNDRQLKNLSLGIWTQEQYCHESGNPYRPDMPDLSGTMFHEGLKSNNTKNTENSGGAERSLTPDTPTKGGGESQ